MRKILKQMLSVALAVIICVSALPVVQAEETSISIGDKIQFGSYPQSKVTDEAIISELTDVAPEWDEWRSFDYYSGNGSYGSMSRGNCMRYIDVTVDNKKYRGVKFEKYRPFYTHLGSSASNTYQDQHGYYVNTAYWFEFEPIYWRILDKSTGLLLCDTIIDSQAYNNTIYYKSGQNSTFGYFSDNDFLNFSNNYETSSIREWLNKDFYETAFSEVEKEKINAASVDNTGYYTIIGKDGYENFDGDNTTESIFLLSYNDLINKEYGFNADSSQNDLERCAKGSDYSKVQGLSMPNATENDYLGNNYWMLRSAGKESISCCGITSNGLLHNNYHTYGSLLGVRPAFYLDVEYWEKESVSSEATSYIQQHIDFIENGNYSKLINNADFYNSFWQYEESDRNFTAYAAWELIGDMGEFMFGNLDDFFVTENPYDIILADVLASYASNVNTENACKKGLEYVFKADSAYKNFITLLKSSSSWDDSIDENDLTLFAKTLFNKTEESLIKGVFFSPSKSDIKKDYPEMFEAVKGVFSGISDSKLNSIFSGINNISTIIGYINTGADVVDSFMDAYQKYIIAKTLVSTKSDAIGALVAASYDMKPYYQTLLNISIDSYLEVLDYDSAFDAVSNYMVGSSAMNVHNVFKGSLTELVYEGIASIFGVAVSAIKKVIIAYNATHAFLDYFAGIGQESEMFFILNATAVLEKSLKDIVISCGNTLVNIQTIDKATRFDTAYGLLQSVEQYSYSGLAKYISAMKREFAFDYSIKSTMGSFVIKYLAMKELNENRASVEVAIETANYFEGEWRNHNCHTENSSGSKTVSVKCPTDVYVYNEEGEYILSIINNEIIIQESNISVIVDGDEKIFSLPNTENYVIEIVGTDDGTMTYSVYDSEETNIIKYTEYSDIKLTKNCVYSGYLSNMNEEDTSRYELILIYCEHSGGMSSCISKAICDKCYQPYGEVNPANHIGKTEIRNEKASTCTEQGYTGDEYCLDCGEKISSGENKDVLGHSDSDKNNSCDVCGETIKICSHLCHKDGFIGFIWKIIRFFFKLFRCQPVCGCGMTHY